MQPNFIGLFCYNQIHYAKSTNFMRTIFTILLAVCVLSTVGVLAQENQHMPATINGDTVFTLVQQPPEYVGGDKALGAFLSQAVDLSKIKTEICYYSLAVGKNGEIMEVRKLKGSDKNELLLINALNKTTGQWEAGKQNGHTVNVYAFVALSLKDREITADVSKQKTEPPQITIVDNKYERGKIKDGYKTGVWEYYDNPGELALKINYTSSQLLYLKPDTSWYAIKINENWESVKLDMQPRYIGTMNDFKKIDDGFKFPQEALEKRTCGKFYITFEVDTLGQAGNYMVINDIGSKCAETVISFLQSLPNYWLVAKKDGKNYVSKFLIPVTFKIVYDGKELIPKKRKSVMELPPVAKQLDEIVITIMGITTEKVRIGY